jgi:hypothetical protein
LLNFVAHRRKEEPPVLTAVQENGSRNALLLLSLAQCRRHLLRCRDSLFPHLRDSIRSCRGLEVVEKFAERSDRNRGREGWVGRTGERTQLLGTKENDKKESETWK